MSADEFFSGKTSAPIYIDLESKQATSAPQTPAPSAPTSAAKASTPAAAEQPKSASFPPPPATAAEQPAVETIAKSSPPEDLTRGALGSAMTASSTESPSPTLPKEVAASNEPASASPALASANHSASRSDKAEVEQLRQQVERLESQLSERDSMIRTLELKVCLCIGVSRLLRIG